MPFGRATEPIVVVRGYPRYIEVTIYELDDEAGEYVPADTTGWSVLGAWFNFSGVSIALEGDSALSIDSAGKISGTVAAAVTAQLPMGQLTDLTIVAALDESVEPVIVENTPVEVRAVP